MLSAAWSCRVAARRRFSPRKAARCNAVYARLAPELLPELKKAASKQEKKAKLHQLLTQDVGHPKLKEHLASVVTLLKLAKDKDDFSRMLDIVHPKLNNTIPLDLGE